MRLSLFTILLILSLNTFAQNLGKGITYSTELNTTFSNGDYAPFWLSSNKFGLSSVESNSSYYRICLSRSINTDSLKGLRFGYGADIALLSNHTSDFIIQQLYGEMKFNKGKILIGAKEQNLEYKNAELSSGDLTYSTNSRPVPQLRIELDDYWNLPLTDGWLSFKGHIAYGFFTDNKWQKSFVNDRNNSYTQNSKFHSKTGYVKIGKEEIFPITFIGGVHFCSQFGGEAWNIGKRADDTSGFNGSHIKMDSGAIGYWHAFFPGGRDATDGNYDNAEGNTLGSYHAYLKYQGKEWSIMGYAEHFFEDHSQMFFQYDWKDFLLGIEISFPENRFINTLVYEHIGTKDQTGSVYHDHTENLPQQISGRDNYYNHNIYGGWQHWGQAIGNPLLLSPIYNTNGAIQFYHNRISAHHVGFSGSPCSKLRYRILYSHVNSLGSYSCPLPDPEKSDYFLAELTYTKISGKWSLTGSFALDRGSITGNSTGCSITIRKKGVISK